MRFWVSFVALATIAGVGATPRNVPHQLTRRQNQTPTAPPDPTTGENPSGVENPAAAQSSNPPLIPIPNAPPNGTAPGTNGTAPCGVVAATAARQLAANPKGTFLLEARPIVDGQLAFDCLNSVALRKPEAQALVDAVKPYVEWQSDLAYLKDPPSDYPFPPVDIVESLKAVENNLTAGKYRNEIQFQTALFKVFTQAHDGHFDFFPDALTRAFVYRRPMSLVSYALSESFYAVKLKSKLLADTQASLAPGSTFKPSAVTKINGIEASRFLQEMSDTDTPFQDKDAAYNAMFATRAGQSQGFNGFFQSGGPFSFIFPGPTTQMTFENGTTREFRNEAQLRASFTGVVDGDTFFKKFCSGPPAAAAPPSPTNPTTTPTPSTAPPPVATVPGYPQPVIIASDGSVSGYYLQDPGNTDVAVLSVLTFAPEKPDEFQRTIQRFISIAKGAGKKKMVIDTSLNGGGFLFLGYDLFRQFFPQIAQDGFTRFRQNAAFTKISEIVSESIPPNFSQLSSSDEEIQTYEIWYNYKFDLDMTNNTFPNRETKFGDKIKDKGDTFSSLVRWNMADPLSTSNTTYGIGINITGYGNLSQVAQPFPAEDVILLYDGFCASTCTVFSEFMRLQGNVKSVAVGGRPSNTKIQGIGGVKGSQSYAWSAIFNDAQRALEIQQKRSMSTAAELLVMSDLPVNRSSAAGVNLRDNILPQNMGDGVPAQFVQELADCRLYYTPQMMGDVRQFWNAAAKATWGGGPCVAGGFTQKPVVQTGAVVGGVGPSRTEVTRTEVVRSDVVLNKDAGWERRHEVKFVYNHAANDAMDTAFDSFDSYIK
ncbi:hypothetical protein HYFRA_00000174 [Hymenoscyphus fraxineus]|uniref:CPAF-like PDZ domain-containing protein n=1 Tax=Hymenoscyphus fraxineus TaxID=746836 RepID=A0A9N9L2D3_9HELO|nr:hypothetical protein HYFRA_00000174 [Hymenoscyphus fraxineus]